MKFFGPISPPLLDETSSPLFRHALQRARIVGSFAAVQAAVQIIGFLSGILLVREMAQREYAYFTIVNSMQGTINILADIGISIGLVSIGGRVWHDRGRFGELVSTALKMRRKLGAAAMILITPVLFLLLIKNGAPFSYSIILIAALLLGLLVQLSVGVLGVVPRLRSDIGQIQKIDLIGAIVRLGALLLLTFFFLNAGLAIAVSALCFVLQYWLLRRYVAGVIDLHAPENVEDRSAMRGFIKNQAANALFFCFQGQITIFLISFFGQRAGSVAEVGALGRLAMIFLVLSNLLTNILVPAFARCQNARQLRWLYASIVGGATLFSLAVLGAAAFFPQQFLFVLGHQYQHLERELLLMVGGAVISALTGTFWALNASKAWITGSWLYIPFTLTTQAAMIPFTDFSSVSGVLIFNLLSAMPNLFLNFVLSYRGFRSLNPENG